MVAIIIYIILGDLIVSVLYDDSLFIYLLALEWNMEHVPNHRALQPHETHNTQETSWSVNQYRTVR